MATKVWKVDNQLRIDDGTNITYGNAAWYAIAGFTEDEVTLMYMGRSNDKINFKINFADFQDGDENPYSTEAEIADYLAPLIG
ncbi:MAG: hypothetical protein ACOVOV_00770 [Dolichospermum sp.]